MTPEEDAEYRKWHSSQYEQVDYQPKPREFLPKWDWWFEHLWTNAEVTRKTLRLFCVGVLVFMLVSSFLMSYGEDLMAPRASSLMHRISAGAFLAAVIANFIYELGWRGGDHNR